MNEATLALGLKVCTGKAVVLALRGPIGGPSVVARELVQVATTFEEGAVYHAAQEMPLEAARVHVVDAAARFTGSARRALADLLARLEAEGTVRAARMSAPAAAPLPPLEEIVRSHPRVHAAEIALYREVFAGAREALGLPTARVTATTAEVARAIHLDEALVVAQLAAMGRAAGPPWTAQEKEAALAAWPALR